MSKLNLHSVLTDLSVDEDPGVGDVTPAESLILSLVNALILLGFAVGMRVLAFFALKFIYKSRT